MYDPLLCENKNVGEWLPHKFVDKPDPEKSASSKKQLEADFKPAKDFLMQVECLKSDERFTLKTQKFYLYN